MLAPSSRQRTTSSPVAASKNSPVFHPSQESCSPASFTNVSPQASTPRAAAPMLSFTAALRALMGVESAQQASYPVLSRSWWKQITSTMGVTKVSVCPVSGFSTGKATALILTDAQTTDADQPWPRPWAECGVPGRESWGPGWPGCRRDRQVRPPGPEWGLHPPPAPPDGPCIR